MKSKSYPIPQTLMAIDHPEWLFDLLCSVEGNLDKTAIANKLVAISKGKIRSAKSKSIEMYMYVLTTLKLLESNKNGQTTHHRSALGDELCDHYGAHELHQFRKALRSILLKNNIFKHFFKRLLSLIRDATKRNEPITFEDLRKKFLTYKGEEAETARTLKSLGVFSGMIVERNGQLGLTTIMQKKPQNPSYTQFVNELRRSFKSFASRSEEGKRLRTIYIEIWKLRDLVLARLGQSEQILFDNYFQDLLSSPQGRRSVHLYGAAPQWYPDRLDPEYEEKIFRFNGKIYAFVSSDWVDR